VSPDREAAARAEHDEPRNAAVLASNFVLGRIGWIFKTESVIVPAFVDALSGAGWVRGLLPIVNRVSQSVPPFLLASAVQRAPLKKRVYFGAAIAMSLPFTIVGFVLLGIGEREPPGWLVWLFLALYAAFFASTGIWANAQGSLQGKLIAPSHRGRLMAASTSIGALLAAFAAWWLLPGWLEPPGTLGFAYAFLFCGAAMSLAALCAPLLQEHPDAPAPRAPEAPGAVGESIALLRANVDLRRAVALNVFFISSLALLPHYQALARDHLGLGGSDWMVWVVVQNVSMAMITLFVGPLVDRTGNRLGLRLAIFASAATPVLALFVARLEPELGRRLFPLIFVGVGLTPVVIRLFQNYMLEITPRGDHPRALSITQIASVVALAASPLFGALIDAAGYAPVFLIVAGSLAIAGGITFLIAEPRRTAGDRR
jgi:hypothetical protein